jgi:tetratricopeptide (TPR) repeat protein
VDRRTFLLGCGGCSVLPPRFTRPELEGEEGGLWAYMDREERRLQRSPFLIRNEDLNTYVRAIACRLAGEHCPDLRVYIVRTAQFNASMAPNGMMQVWSGLLLRMSNEAQLAAIIGHEIGHYLARHGLDRLREAKSRTAIGQVLSIALSVAAVLGGAVNSLTQLALTAGGLAYGRDQEREADRIGVELMASAGYAPIEAARVWSQLLEEAKAEDSSLGRSVLFATHPPAEEREQMLTEAAARITGGRVGAETYRQVLAPHRTTFLRDEILRARHGETLVMLDRMPQDGEVLFFKGEVYRMRESLDDALGAYRAAETLDGAPPELYRSMGLVLRRTGARGEAARAFARYLELKRDASDAEIVRTYL